MKQLFFQLCDLMGLNALFRFLHRGQVKVLLYHSISPTGGPFNNAVSPDDFRAHLQHLRSRYNVVGLDAEGRFTGHRTDRVNVLITFDDGFVDNAHTAAVLLQDACLPAVFFLIADNMATGSPPGFILSRLQPGAVPHAATHTLTVGDALALIPMGIEIGSHGLAHVDYAKVGEQEAMQDAVDSAQHMQASLGRSVKTFAFPWGQFRPGQDQALLVCFNKVFLTTHGFNRESDKVFHRNEVAGLAQMRCACSGVLDFFATRT
jgi:peptidoglycan/xylan/chitin deacetylase (PgdA/CDA1 family)